MSHNTVMLLDNEDGLAMVRKTCKESGIRFSVFMELVQTGIDEKRRADRWDAFDDILDRIEAGDDS